MKIKLLLKSLLLLFLFSACNKPSTVNTEGTSSDRKKTDSLKPSQVISIDSPKVVPAGKPITLKPGKPTVVPVNINIVSAGTILTSTIGILRKKTPGSDSIEMPKQIKVTGKVVRCKQPLPVPAAPPRIKDDATINISYLGMDEGMNSNSVNEMLEDKTGNIWFATNGGGVSKYDGKTFLHYTEKQGLTNNYVSCIMQDIDGNLWFGTSGGGVSKYDGTSFTNFTEKEGLTNNSVTSIIQDGTGNIWFGTNGGGVVKYDGENFSCYSKKSGLADNIVLSMLEDETGNIWLGTLYGGVDKYDGKSFYNYSEQDGLSKNWVSAITEDKAGNTWFCNRNGGADKLHRREFTHFTKESGLSSNIVSSLLEDKAGNFWFGTHDGGVNKYDGKTFIRYSEKEGLNDNNVNCVLEDRNGNIWLGTANGGVNKLEPNSFVNYTIKDGLINDKVGCMAEDTSGSIWFGCSGGISRYDGRFISNYTDKEGLSSNNINALYADKTGNLWVGTNERGIIKYDGKTFTNYTEKEGLSNNCIRCITGDKEGNIWFATVGVGVNKFDGKSFTHFTEKNGLGSNYVTCIIADKNNNIWFGTQAGGVTKYNGKSFIVYTKKQGLISNKVSSVAEDKKGNLWFGTNGEGIIKYDGNKLISYTEKEGLSNNTVRALITDKHSNLWASTLKGLTIIDGNETNSNALLPFIKTITKQEGLKDNRFMPQSVLLDSKGTAWWGGYKSLNKLNLNKYVFPQNPPSIQLNSIDLEQTFIDFNLLKDTLEKGGKITIGDYKNLKVLNEIKFKDVAPFSNYPRNLVLPYYLNYITFHYSAIDWQAPYKLKYVYMLEGLDKDWSPLTEATTADYRNLPPGNFTFKVNAIGIAGKWCDGFQYAFVIRSPWWQTWWFLTFVAVAIIILLYSFFRSRTAFLRKRQVVLQNIIVERTSDVVQQRQEVEKRNEIIEIKQKEILASIKYAQRIQRSLLPPVEEVMAFFPDSFILFKPKDIVSGDFYWFFETENKLLIAAADCTGHGVPGAFMSAICSEKLNEAVPQSDDVAVILQFVNSKMKKVLRQYGKDDSTHDGMDIALCSFNKENNEMEYAGANRPIWIIRNNENEAEEIIPNKVSIGGFTDSEQLFTKHKILLKKGDAIYIFSDGYADQFGPKNKKLMTRKFKEILLSISDKPMDEQKKYLDNFIEEWKDAREQTDDILVIGIKV